MTQQVALQQLQIRKAWQRHCQMACRSPSHMSPYFDPTAKRCSSCRSVRAGAGKGFGKPQDAQTKPAPKQKRKRPDKSPGGKNLQAEHQRAKAEDVQQQVPEFDASFEDRLKGLKQQGAQRLSEVKQEIGEAELSRNIYDDPPPLTKTLFGNKDKKEGSEESSGFFNQAALTVGSLLLIGIFVLVSGGSDLANFAAPQQAAPQTQELSADQKAQLQRQAQDFEAELGSNAGDLDALEGAGVSYAQLGDFKRAEGLLAKLTNAKPDDAEAWRLLAETRLKLADNRGAATAFEQAMAASPSIDLLQNLAAAYVNDGKPQAAIAAVQAAGQRLPTSQAELVNFGYGENEISLLLGRVYAQWPGHDSQALDIYDKLIQKSPNDFRGYLARGVLFRGEGRQGDAERMFLQARYIAPKESRGLVDRVIGSS